MRSTYLLFFLFYSFQLLGQKKGLDHSVYDGWQSIGERIISNDGKWVVYAINPQEGDNQLVIQSSDGHYKKIVERGYNADITEDSRFVILKIKPCYKDTREAKIKKRKQDDLPKDSLAIVELGKDSVWKKERIKSYSAPEKSFGWVVYQLEKPLPDTSSKTGKTTFDYSKTIDSLKGIIDSLQAVNKEMQDKKRRTNKDGDPGYFDFADDDSSSAAAKTATDLILKRLPSGEEKVFKNVSYY